MKSPIDTLLEKFEAGGISRRQFVGHLTALFAIFAGLDKGLTNSEQMQVNSLFQVSEINHLALRVTDLDRSQKFYEDVLGMQLIRKLPNARFMSCGPHFVALFKSSEPKLDHLAFTLPSYDQGEVAEKLRSKGIAPMLEEDRTYFRDPDGYVVQIEHPQAWPGDGKRPESKS